MGDELNDLAARLDDLVAALGGSAMDDAALDMGMKLLEVADDAVAGDVGTDRKMRGWPRKSPAVISTRARIVAARTVRIQPERRAAGQMRVLEEGRAENRTGFRTVTRRRKATGETYQAQRKVRRGVGAMKPKGTWTAVEADIDAHVVEFGLDAVYKIGVKHLG